MRVSSQEAGGRAGRGQRALPVWGAYSPSAVASASALASGAASSSGEEVVHIHTALQQRTAQGVQVAREEGLLSRPRPADPRSHPLGFNESL